MRVYKFLTAHFALKSLYEERLKISRFEDLNDPFELIPYELSDRANRTAMYQARDELTRDRGVMCFSADWINPVIWTHYADNHRGICLGFEIPDRMCKHIRYESVRLPFPTLPLTLKHAEDMLFTKFSSWEYEQEVRSWTNLDEVEDGIYYKDFDNTLRLAEVVVGARSTVPRAAIVRALRSPDDVKLLKARAGFTKFEIVIDQQGL